MANIEIRMSAPIFFSENMSILKKLPKEQRQKIANFWTEDVDGSISNPIEKAILEGLMSDSGKIPMPTVPEQAKFKERANLSKVGEYCDIYDLQDYSMKIDNFNNGSKKISIFYEKRSHDNIVKDDSLIDYDNDGFADCRSITINGVSYFGSQTYYDTNLDGHYDKKENNNAEKYINEMLSDDDDL